jgi:hypothetical protein
MLAMAGLVLCSCGIRHSSGSVFEVLPVSPEYVLRSPEAQETPFSQVLRQYNGFVPGQDWLDLHPHMRLRVENAYYQAGLPKHGLNGFLGTEIALYRVRDNGFLQMVSTESKLPQLPADQSPVERLLPASEMRYREHRFFLAVKFSRRAEASPSVLLGANSSTELEALSARLQSSPDSVCHNSASHCVVFPEACSVSAEIEIVVNGVVRILPWDSTLSAVADKPKRVELLRLHAGRLTPVKLDPSDANALRLPLLPGDHLAWQ